MNCDPVATSSANKKDPYSELLNRKKTCKRKYADTSLNSHKRLKMSTSSESVTENEISNDSKLDFFFFLKFTLFLSMFL